MAAKQPPRPAVDHWYKSVNGDIFEVVAVDEKDDGIEIQYLDGSIEELDEDSWESLSPKVIDPPHKALAEDYEEEEGEPEYDDVDLDEDEDRWSRPFDEYE